MIYKLDIVTMTRTGMNQTDNNSKIIDSKEERFRRLAERRVNGILDKLRLLGQLSNRRNYTYDRQQVEVIFKAINKEVRSTKAKFNPSSSNSTKFRL